VSDADLPLTIGRRLRVGTSGPKCRAAAPRQQDRDIIHDDRRAVRQSGRQGLVDGDRIAETLCMGELQVGEGGVADHQSSTRPVERERIGQASIDWKESGSAERVGYDEWQRRYVNGLLEEGRIEELRSAAMAGTALARARLAEIYAAQGRIEELRSLAGARNEGLALLLADTLAGQDNLEVKVAVLKVRLEVGEKDARDQLIGLLTEQGRADQAVTFLRAHAHEDVEWQLLARLLLVQGRVEELQALANEDRRPDSRSSVAAIFAEQGMIDEVRAIVTPGSPAYLARVLAHALVRQGRVDEGIAVLQERVDANEEHSREWLIDLLVEQGRADQAVTLLKGIPYSFKSISTADVRVARLLDEQGRAEDAIKVLQSTGGAPEKHAALLAARGRIDEAVWVIDRAISYANPRYPAAIERFSKALADLFVEHGRIDELRTRAASGHPAYSVRLAEHDRPDEPPSRHGAGNQNTT
jgi:hypothetical protein